MDRYWGEGANRREFRFSLNLRYWASDRLIMSTYAFRGNSHGDFGYVNDEADTLVSEKGELYEKTDIWKR